MTLDTFVGKFNCHINNHNRFSVEQNIAALLFVAHVSNAANRMQRWGEAVGYLYMSLGDLLLS